MAPMERESPMRGGWGGPSGCARCLPSMLTAAKAALTLHQATEGRSSHEPESAAGIWLEDCLPERRFGWRPCHSIALSLARLRLASRGLLLTASNVMRYLCQWIEAAPLADVSGQRASSRKQAGSWGFRSSGCYLQACTIMPSLLQRTTAYTACRCMVQSMQRELLSLTASVSQYYANTPGRERRAVPRARKQPRTGFSFGAACLVTTHNMRSVNPVADTALAVSNFPALPVGYTLS